MPTPSMTFFLSGNTLFLLEGTREINRRTLRPEDHDAWKRWAERYGVLLHANNLDSLMVLGQEIFRWLDGDGNWLAFLGRQGMNGCELVFAVPEHDDPHAHLFWAVPWEIMAQGGKFLAERIPPIMPMRRYGEASEPAVPKYGNCHIMLMAAAPEGASALDHEAEEVGIMGAVQGLPVQLDVEESGCLEFLAQRLGNEHLPEVLHLICHGNIDDAGEPYLALETPTGAVDMVDPNTFIGAFPQGEIALVFVSACRTAEARSGQVPFATRLVQGGVATVLGWDGSVLDQDACLFAASFYGALSKGFSVGRAAAMARTSLLKLALEAKGGDHWHLARVMMTRHGGGPLIRPGAARRSLWRADAGRAFLDPENQKVRVAGPEEFVGRRRQAQAVIRAFRENKRVVMLQGAGRLGKSSLAARVAQRMRGCLTAVVFMQYDRRAIFQAIWEKLPPKQGLEIQRAWSAEVDRGDEGLYFALKAILENPCAQDDPSQGQHPLLLIIDDLERILEDASADQTGDFRVKNDDKGALEAVLRAFKDANATQSRLLITSRHPFTLPYRGVDLGKSIQRVSLAPMSARERTKLAQAALRSNPNSSQVNLDDEQTQELIFRADRASTGNPGLQRLLIQPILSCEMEAARAGIQAVEDYLAQRIAPLAGSDVADMFTQMAFSQYLAAIRPDERTAFQSLTVFNLPAPQSVAVLACQHLGTAVVLPSLARLQGLGLVHQVPSPGGGDPHLLADPLAAVGVSPLTEPQKKDLAEITVEPLFAAWCDDQGGFPSFEIAWEMLRLVEQSGGHPDILAAASDATGWRLFKRATDKESFETVLSRATNALIALEQAGKPLWLSLVRLAAGCAKALGKTEVADSWLQRGLNLDDGDAREKGQVHLQWAEILPQKGDMKGAFAHLDQAQAFFKDIGNDYLLALVAGTRADLLMTLGDLDEAYRVRTEEQLPIFEHLGDIREIAVTKGKLADILLSRGALDEAYRVCTEETLPVYERLGDIREIAVTKGKLADILFRRGDLDEAYRVRTEEQLPIFERLGDVRSIAVTKGRLADILEARGDGVGALEILQREMRPLVEELKDEELFAYLLYRISAIRLNQGNLTQDEFLVEVRDLTDAFMRAQKLGRPDFIGTIGLFLGQVHMSMKAFKPALEALTIAEAGFRKMNWNEQADRVAELARQATLKL
ncbi:MAG: CHAT domain-containing protein [Nitrospirae bacterium]|nr:CHAT domain-containing protein [Magnetococcales bacterium]